MMANDIAIPELADLAARINAEHEQAKGAAINAVAHGIAAGELLLEAKAKVEHGQWLPWIESNCAFSQRTAQAYARLAKHAPKLLDQMRSSAADFSIRDAMKALTPPSGAVTASSGDSEWYTPPKYIESARAAMGGIDLDPASCDFAQEAVGASSYYTKSDNGLQKPWHGRVWLNPPYSGELMLLFVDKLLLEYGERRVGQAIMLTHNYTENEWFQKAEKIAERLCFTDHRVKFQKEESGASSPQRGSCFFYFGDDSASFEREFSQWGFVR
jgi:ParB family chromosome partitioning protein